MRPIRILAVLVPLVALAACSSNAGTSTTAPPTTAPTTAASMAATSPAASSATAELMVGTKAGLGSFLTDGNGMTLYVFAKDSSGMSACTGSCAANWPALTVASGQQAMAGPGVSGTIATITRSDDGKLQVTYDGAPLYYFAKDAAAGDTNGQGIGGLWHAASPDGGGVGAPASPASSPTPSHAVGY